MVSGLRVQGLGMFRAFVLADLGSASLGAGLKFRRTCFWDHVEDAEYRKVAWLVEALIRGNRVMLLQV